MNSGTRTTLIGISVTVIGALTLAAPGGWDWLSAINIWMGGMLVGLGWAYRWIR